MSLAWRVIRTSISDFADEILWLVLLNVLWCIAAVTVIGAPLVSAGMAWIAAEIGEGKVLRWSTFTTGIRRYWKQSYLWALINVIVAVLVGMNLAFYSGRSEPWSLVPLFLFGALGLWWAGMQFYFFPFLTHQESPSMRTAYRNGIVLMLSQPGLSIVMFLVVIILTAISYFFLFPFFLFFFALLSVLSNRAVIETIRYQTEQAEAAEEERQSKMPDQRWRPPR
ncbi:MAG: hypothetical protein ACP5R2_14540 [Anaerolineae bacterium]